MSQRALYLSVVAQGIIGAVNVLCVKMGWMVCAVVLNLSIFALVGLQCAQAESAPKDPNHRCGH